MFELVRSTVSFLDDYYFLLLFPFLFRFPLSTVEHAHKSTPSPLRFQIFPFAIFPRSRRCPLPANPLPFGPKTFLLYPNYEYWYFPPKNMPFQVLALLIRSLQMEMSFTNPSVLTAFVYRSILFPPLQNPIQIDYNLPFHPLEPSYTLYSLTFYTIHEASSQCPLIGPPFDYSFQPSCPREDGNLRSFA